MYSVSGLLYFERKVAQNMTACGPILFWASFKVYHVHFASNIVGIYLHILPISSPEAALSYITIHVYIYIYISQFVQPLYNTWSSSLSFSISPWHTNVYHMEPNLLKIGGGMWFYLQSCTNNLEIKVIRGMKSQKRWRVGMETLPFPERLQRRTTCTNTVNPATNIYVLVFQCRKALTRSSNNLASDDTARLPFSRHCTRSRLRSP